MLVEYLKNCSLKPICFEQVCETFGHKRSAELKQLYIFL